MNKLDEYLTILLPLQKYGLEEFIRDPEHYGSAERFLQLAIETVTDLGNHVIADLALGIVNSYSDIPSILAEQRYLSADLKDKWIRMLQGPLTGADRTSMFSRSCTAGLVGALWQRPHSVTADSSTASAGEQTESTLTL